MRWLVDGLLPGLDPVRQLAARQLFIVDMAARPIRIR
jgi:hypothetical protein